MKRIILCLLSIFSLQAYGSGLAEGTAAAILSPSLDPKANFKKIMAGVCSAKDNPIKPAECYKTPNGKRVYEYEPGIERNKWYNIAKEENRKLIRAKNERKQFEREQGRHAAEQYRQNQTRCKFWQDQNDSPRRTEILKNDC